MLARLWRHRLKQTLHCCYNVSNSRRMFGNTVSGKSALVTGSTSGIGLAIAKCLASNGCKVILHGSREKKDATAAINEVQSRNKEIPIHYIQTDLKQPNGAEYLCNEVDKIVVGGLDILVNNAGTQHVCPVEEFPIQLWHEMMTLNLTSPFILTRHVVPKMKQKGWGRIVNISSVRGVIGGYGKAPYCASKSGLNGMTRAVALETAPFGVTCNVICPGWVETPLVDIQFAECAKENNVSFEEAREIVLSREMPSKKIIDPVEIAELTLFLCSSAGSSISGFPIPVDSGMCVR